MRGRALLGVTVALALAAPARAQAVSPAEARAAATGWVATITAIKGHWAGSQHAVVGEPRELERGGRAIGYYCPVEPSGFVVVPLHRELAPVRFYSATGTLDPETDEGLADLVKARMERVLRRLEGALGPLDQLAPGAVRKLVKADYRAAWDELTAGPAPRRPPDDGAAQAKTNYQGGTILLATGWHQGDPYFRQCPYLVGNEACDNALVGCVPLAAAQIMRYWTWPPYGVGFPYYYAYDWVNMAEVVDASSPQAEIDAVARLCHEAGEASDVDYGCSATSGFISCWWWGCTSQEDAFKDRFRYTLTDSQDRDDADSAEEWFGGIKEELNHNRPMQYGIPKHSVVIDGWQEVGETPLRQYHVNYGWGLGLGQNTGWYTVDEIPGGDPDDEERLSNIRPQPYVGAAPGGVYPTDNSFPYRYFDEDASGTWATFVPGQNLQFLGGVTLAGTGSNGDWVEISGWVGAETRLATGGDASRGAVLRGSAIKLQGGGALTLAPLGPPKYPQGWYNRDLRAVALIWEEGWGAPSGAVIERRVFDWEAWRVVGTVSGGSTFFYDADILPARVYSYRLRSSGGGRLSEFGRIVLVGTPNPL